MISSVGLLIQPCQWTYGGYVDNIVDAVCVFTSDWVFLMQSE